ncbi:MAG: GNAT family N-acetyltransferase [Planktothrix sp.]|uniref:GNAT family N-acetyltransferase n=1 Tax=Planktothrix sp. TaxID=3088171 RepID=UPI0038D43DCA
MNRKYQTFLIRDWQPQDRETATGLIASVLTEYGLGCEPCGADLDVYEVEKYYQQTGGEFWVVEQNTKLVGTAGFYPIQRGIKAVEIRKMYLLSEVRGKGLGKFLLLELERVIKEKGFKEIWIETASVLQEAVKLYEKYGYQPTTGVETKRCDLVYKKEI